ncbi:MAG: hypothetical protein ACI8SR_003547 [Oceanicoccus sp.]|jgi:hypothetical protein
MCVIKITNKTLGLNTPLLHLIIAFKNVKNIYGAKIISEITINVHIARFIFVGIPIAKAGGLIHSTGK